MKLKGIGQGRHRTNAELEPNFYSMKPVAGPGDNMDAESGIASALAVARLQQQQQLGASHSAAMAANALNNATSLNAFHLFGNNVPAGTASTAGTGSATTFDLNNLFFLTNGGDLNQASQVNAVLMPQNQQERNFQAAQQGSANSSAFLLANLLNNGSNHVASTSNVNENGMHAPAAFDLSNGSSQHHYTYDPGAQLQQDMELSNLRNLLQNTDANPVAAQTLMQYMADSNSDTSSQAPSAQTVPANAATNGVAPMSWPTHGGTPRTHQSQQIDNVDYSNALRNTAGLASTDDLAGSFGLEGSSLRRMSTSAMTSFLSSHIPGSYARNDSSNATATHYSNSLATSPHISSLEAPNMSNIRRLSSLTGRHSESANDLLQLLEATGASTDAPGFMASQQANRGTYQARQPSASASGTQHYSILNSATGGGGAGSSISELLGGNRMAQAASNPTFLDSVYEPIPIKDGTGGDGQQKSADRTSPSGSVNSHSLTGRPSSPGCR